MVASPTFLGDCQLQTYETHTHTHVLSDAARRVSPYRRTKTNYRRATATACHKTLRDGGQSCSPSGSLALRRAVLALAEKAAKGRGSVHDCCSHACPRLWSLGVPPHRRQTRSVPLHRIPQCPRHPWRNLLPWAGPSSFPSCAPVAITAPFGGSPGAAGTLPPYAS